MRSSNEPTDNFVMPPAAPKQPEPKTETWQRTETPGIERSSMDGKLRTNLPTPAAKMPAKIYAELIAETGAAMINYAPIKPGHISVPVRDFLADPKRSSYQNVWFLDDYGNLARVEAATVVSYDLPDDAPKLAELPNDPGGGVLFRLMQEARERAQPSQPVGTGELYEASSPGVWLPLINTDDGESLMWSVLIGAPFFALMGWVLA